MSNRLRIAGRDAGDPLRFQMKNALEGCIIGTAVGDSLGLAYEGLSPGRAGRMFPQQDKYHFFLHFGMMSDDTEHTLMVAQALLDSQSDPETFSSSLARRLRWWFLGIPAGIGLATLRSLFKLCIGYSPMKSGVFSAGNGPAMRSAIIGLVYGAEVDTLKRYVRRSTIITHTDPKAYYGAIAVALAAYMSATAESIEGGLYQHALHELLSDEKSDEFEELISRVIQSVEQNESTAEFYQYLAPGSVGGISGYIYHTVPAVIHAWLRHPNDFRRGLLEIIGCGGDTDTTGAILGGIIGARVGTAGIPKAWMNGIIEFPRNVSWMKTLAGQLHKVMQGHSEKPIHAAFPLVFLRNIFFTIVVLFHGFRRIFPPY